MNDVMAKLAAWIEEAVEYVNSETRSRSLEREGRALLAAYEQAQAEPKQAAEPVAWIPVDALAQLKDPLLLLRNVPLYAYAGEDLAPIYTAPVAQAATPAPAEPSDADKDLAMMLRRCASALQAAGREEIAAAAMGLLGRLGLGSSPLRERQAATPAPAETFDEKCARNARVQSRYDELMREGKHGHYETMFRVVREEVERALGKEPRNG